MIFSVGADVPGARRTGMALPFASVTPVGLNAVSHDGIER